MPLRAREGYNAFSGHVNMPVDVQMLSDGLGWVASCRGTVTGDEFIQRTEKLLRSPDRLQKLRYAILDLTDASFFDFSASQEQCVADQAQQLAVLLPSFVHAVILTSDLPFGISRMWEALCQQPGWSTRTFRSRSEANTWVRQEMNQRFGQTVAPAEP
jgi:hypothetical protein